MSDLIRRIDAIRVVSGLSSGFVKYIEEIPPATCDGCKHKNTWDEECKQCIRLWSYLHDNYEEEHT